MRNKIKIGRTIGAAVALSAAVLMSPNAYAMSELEELMGEPVEALSDDELGELRGGFSFRGFGFDGPVEFNVGVMVRETVDGRVQRISQFTARSVGGALTTSQQNIAYREIDYSTESLALGESTSESIDGAANTASDTVVVADTVAATDPAPQTTFETNTETPATASVQQNGEMSFQVQDNSSSLAGEADIGSSVEAALAGSGLVSTQSTIDQNNSNVVVDRVVNLDLTNYSVINAFAARARVESKISSIVNSQVLFQLGQQF